MIRYPKKWSIILTHKNVRTLYIVAKNDKKSLIKSYGWQPCMRHSSCPTYNGNNWRFTSSKNYQLFSLTKCNKNLYILAEKWLKITTKIVWLATLYVAFMSYHFYQHINVPTLFDTIIKTLKANLLNYSSSISVKYTCFNRLADKWKRS